MFILPTASVFLDFDGTITARDTTHVLRETFAPGAPVADLDAAFARGQMSSRESILANWELVRATPERELRAAAAAVPIDPGFAPLLAYLGAGGAEVAIVSDGFGFSARTVGADYGVRVITNDVDWSTGELVFPHEDRCCACSSCGTCKQAPIRGAKDRGRWTVMVGDGDSDRKAAALADVVFAKGALAVWCAAFGVRFIPFETLTDVQLGIEDIV